MKGNKIIPKIQGKPLLECYLKEVITRWNHSKKIIGVKAILLIYFFIYIFTSYFYKIIKLFGPLCGAL
ncbi:MAG: hypothetical protein ACTSQ1_14100, partial [Promethearchaeota archaeon]